MRKVLAVHHDIEMLDQMAELLKDKFPDLITERVRNASDAADQCRAQMHDPFKAVIVNCSIAPDLRTPRNDEACKGIDFLQSLEQLGHLEVPKILIVPAGTNNIRLGGLRNCRPLVMEDPTKIFDSLVTFVTEAIGDAKDSFQQNDRKEVKIVVSLNLDKQSWEYYIKGVGFSYFKPRVPLQIDSQAFRRLVNRSRRNSTRGDDWEEDLLEIGQDLGSLLFYGNPEFLGDLRDAQAKAGGEERKTICFNIEKSVHSAALEALTDPKEQGFWMLKVPMHRRLIRPEQPLTERLALFKEGSRSAEPFSALVIESPAEGVVENLTDEKGQPLRLDPLHKVTQEAEAVEGILQGRAYRYRRLRPADISEDRSFWSYVQQVLRGEQWDLVHYAGHSHYDERSGKGYLFFPGKFAEKLDIENFNVALDRARVRFIYLSGCNSSEAGFVFEFARLQIPAVLGFRWPVNDWAALEFAQKFYENLFTKGGSPCLDRAFLSTRCAMRDAYKQDKIWAAAMLIMQDPD